MEEQFLSSLANNPQDNQTRLIYSDWLCDNGHQIKSDYLKLEIQYNKCENAGARNKLRKQIRTAKKSLPNDWLLKIQRLPIENCPRKRRWYGPKVSPPNNEIEFHFECEKNWSELKATSNEKVRHCSSCKEDVTFVYNIGQARQLSRTGKCVAICPSVKRSKNDLAQRIRMGRIAPPRRNED